MTTYSTKETAALLRKKLRAMFPGTKFSVRCSTGTASAWISVRWTDGPVYQTIREICQFYEGRSFDGMTDSYNDNGTQLVSFDAQQMPEEVQFSTDGINAYRDLSIDARRLVQQMIYDAGYDLTICDDDGSFLAYLPLFEDFKVEDTLIESYFSSHQIVHCILSAKDLTGVLST